MTQTLNSADHIAKLVLAIAVIICYALDWIRGPWAVVLAILASVVILTFVIRVVYKWLTMD